MSANREKKDDPRNYWGRVEECHFWLHAILTGRNTSLYGLDGKEGGPKELFQESLVGCITIF